LHTLFVSVFHCWNAIGQTHGEAWRSGAFELDVRYLLLHLFVLPLCIGERVFVMYLQQQMNLTLFREVVT